jgi:hypothetical protein
MTINQAQIRLEMIAILLELMLERGRPISRAREEFELLDESQTIESPLAASILSEGGAELKVTRLEMSFIPGSADNRLDMVIGS